MKVFDINSNKLAGCQSGNVRLQSQEHRNNSLTKECVCSTINRIGQVLFGVIVSLFTTGLTFFSRSIRGLFFQNRKAAEENVPMREPVPPTPVISSKAEVVGPAQMMSVRESEDGIAIFKEAIGKIHSCMSSLLTKKKTPGIVFHHSSFNHCVFSLDTDPNYIFKMNLPGMDALPKEYCMEERYEQIIRARTVCRVHQLGLLVIPKVKPFTVKVGDQEYGLLAEERLDFHADRGAQRHYFQRYASDLTEAIRQLAVFICKTGYSDVCWRNNPILEKSLDEPRCRKIGLFDLEEMKGAEIGLFGHTSGIRQGLVGCVTAEQGEMVKRVAEEYGVSTASFARAHHKRKQAIAYGEQLKNIYADRGITGDEPIEVDVSALEFPEYPQKQAEIRECAKEVVDEINRQIEQAPLCATVRGRRMIIIDENTPIAQKKYFTLIDPAKDSDCRTAEEYYWNTYFGYVIKKLLTSQILLDIDYYVNGCECLIQV